MARRLRRLLVLTPQPAQPANSEIARRLRRLLALGAAFWGVAGAFFRPSLRANSEFAGCAGCGVWRGGGGRGGGQAGQARQARPGRRASRPGQPASQGSSQALLSPGGFCGLGGHSWLPACKLAAGLSCAAFQWRPSAAPAASGHTHRGWSATFQKDLCAYCIQPGSCPPQANTKGVKYQPEPV